MPELCKRSITFTIPDRLGGPGVEVLVFEQDGNLVFTVDALDTPNKSVDLRGLFFHINEAVLPGLTVTNMDPIITGTQIAKNVVRDLGNGANMNGLVKEGFDIGIKFGTPGIGKDKVDGPVSFTLDGPGALTLDDIAHMQFGARTTSVGAKLTGIAPAAPDAVADAYTLFEDGQSGLSDPSTVPEGVLFSVLANDTDADGDTLTITGVYGALHGTTQIVDGADADTLPGDAILYTPFEDYSGSDGFTYCISDNAGGTDFASTAVSITAVADVPTLSYEIIAGAQVNQIIVKVTAIQTDADSSEFMDRIELSGIPAGVSVDFNGDNPTSEPDQIVKEFLLTLPMDKDSNFNLNITAFSKETSNGDEESTSLSLPIVMEYKLNQFAPTFLATDQSMWGTGEQFVFDNNTFLGVEQGIGPVSGGNLLTYDFAAYLKAGFQSQLHFEGGEVDASLPYDISISTNYNKTTDVLVIDSEALLNGGGFTTEGPQGSYVLDFIFNYMLDASAGIDLPSPADNIELIDVNWSGNHTYNVLNLNSDDLGYELPLPYGFSIDFAWPNVETTSDSSNIYESTGASNNFLQLNMDVDEFIFALLELPDPFGNSFSWLGGAVYANYDLLDLDLNAGLNFLQKFDMAVQGLPGTLTFEDGTSQSFVFGSDITLTNASLIDAAGDGDGNVEFLLKLDPLVGLTNDTDLGFNVGYNFLLGRFEAGYNLSLDLGLFDVDLGSGSVVVGPLYEVGGSLPVVAVGVYNDTFGLNFQSQDLAFSA